MDDERLPNYFISGKVIIDVKDYMNIYREALFAFYEMVLDDDMIDEMKEDLSETANEIILSGNV